MTTEPTPVDTLISLIDGLTGILYTVATADDRRAAPTTQCDAALALADRVEDALDALPWTGHPDPEGLFDGLSLVGAVARMLGKGKIAPDGAAEALFTFVEQLSLQVDLRWLSSAASPTARRLLPSTVALIGELVSGETGHTTPDLPWPEAGLPRRTSGTLTLLLTEDESDATSDRALDDLRAAGVPYSVVETDETGQAYESLWLPGMAVPLRRAVIAADAQPARPVLSWEHHVALLRAADERAGYAALVAAYLGSGLSDARSQTEVDTLSRVAEALREVYPPAR